MKNKWFKRVLSGTLAALLIAATIPVSAQESANGGAGQTGMSPLAEFFDESQLNPAYIEWLENGGEGLAPSAQNFSYLTKSYARLRSMQNYALLPEEYDLREFGLVEPVPDQGQLGVCWAIAANSAAAGTLLDQFPQTSLSPIHTSWFARRGPEEGEYWYTDDPYLAGGNDSLAVATMAAWKGPVANAKAPLNSDNQQDPEENLRYEADYHLQDAYYMPVGYAFNLDWEQKISDEITKQLLMETGPVTINYFAGGENTYNEETSAYYNSEFQFVDHAVLLVGWDDNYPKENFSEGNQPQNNGAWLVRNSWGTSWGDDGYFWLSYEDQSIQSGNAYLLEEADNYANNYQYDTMGWSYSVALAEDPEQAKTAKAANIFTAEGDEQLEAVSFYTTDAGTQYTISVYTGVEEGQPESGTQQLKGQTGTEPYAGYHTIELEHPVKLAKGERFSVVITYENPDFAAPLAIEWCTKPTKDYLPEHLGSGGESYVCVNETWEDVAGDITDKWYITNVCIKGFTNPLPESDTAVASVRFSEMEGPLADGTDISLTAEGAEEIYYSVDGAAYQKYTAPLTLDFAQQDAHTVAAYAVDNGKQGNTVEKVYTKAVAQLTDLALKYDGVVEHCETDGLTKHFVYLPNCADNVQVMAQSADKIRVNGQMLNSSDWSDGISLTPGETTEITIEVTGSGKTPSTYTLEAYRSMLIFDYEAETVSYDDTNYTVMDTQGNEIKSGDSIAALISTEEKTELTVLPATGGESLTEYIPKRILVSPVGINYALEETDSSFSDLYAYSANADMSEAVQCEYGQTIPLTPGVDVYIQRQATDRDFISAIYHLEVPRRPAAPEVTAEEITDTSVTLQAMEGALYSAGGDWQDTPVFTDLTPGTEYTFQVCLMATENAFRSEYGAAKITTKIPQVNPSDYSFEVKYVDGEGNPVPGGGTISFEEAGPYNREDIPLPYGYMQIIPAHPDEDWLFPTALEWVDGEWKVTNPVVEIMVEKMASVDIIFKTPDGNILEDLNYTRYYDSEGGGIETVPAPEGYEFIGENTYAVEVIRDENEKLVANPSEVAFWVKEIGSEIPVTPSDYSFEVKYIDGEGNPVPGGGTISFEKAGPYNREDIPLPYGYMQIIPAHPDEDWLFPTSLVWVDGEWKVTNPVVEIMVEKMASVDIIFKTPDGNILEDLNYTRYYDSEGGGIETVPAPEGYEFIGENTYAVEVIRDETGKLVADPSEVIFIVKAIDTEGPSDPEEPSTPGGTNTPEGNSPQTGDSSHASNLLLLILVSAGTLLLVTIMRNQKKKEMTTEE